MAGNETEPTQSIEEVEKVWGQLLPLCGTLPRIDLSKDSFKLGRGRDMDYVISESDMGSSDWLKNVSRLQCEIIKQGPKFFIRDLSLNGTWINGNKIGKDNMSPLEHDSELWFSADTTDKILKKVFVFRSMTALTDQFPTQLTDKYTVSKVLGRGAYGEVRLGFRIPDLHRVAIKSISKKNKYTTSSQTIMNEVRILRKIKHPSIINLEDVIDSPDSLFIVLELAEGGALLEKIKDGKKLDEFEAKLHFYQIASGIQYLHSKNICHRDLKPENVLLCTLDDSRPVVKITDMGMAKLFKPLISELCGILNVNIGTDLKTFCGTPNYQAPEVIKMASSSFASYTLKVDCWALGVILFNLLTGTAPFSDERLQGGEPLDRQILTADYEFPLFSTVSEPAQDLIRKLLKVEPKERLSADQIMEHPWLQDSVVSDTAKSIMKEQMDLQARRVIKRNVPMNVNTECGPEKKSRVEINLVP